MVEDFPISLNKSKEHFTNRFIFFFLEVNMLF